MDHESAAAVKWLMAQRMIILAIIGTGMAILMLLVYTAWEGHLTRDHLLDCVTPEGKCYKDGQQRTGDAVSKINESGVERESLTRRIVVLAASCADKVNAQSPKDIERCVNALLKEE